MDQETFDHLARRMGLLISRRVTLGTLGAAGLFAAFGGLRDEVAAKRRRKHKKKKKKPCKAESRGVTCADSCGSIRNNCKQLVDCGDCCEPEAPGDTCAGNKCGFVTNNCGQSVDCSDCIICFHCHDGICQPDPAQRGDPCGETGQVCLANGACLCEAGTCELGTVCLEGACRPCGFNEAPCCESGSCSAGWGASGTMCACASSAAEPGNRAVRLAIPACPAESASTSSRARTAASLGSGVVPTIRAAAAPSATPQPIYARSRPSPDYS